MNINTVNIHINTAILLPAATAAVTRKADTPAPVAETAAHAPTPKLEWSKTLVSGECVTFADAVKAVAELGDDWRLPTRQELESILDLSRHSPCIDTAEFPDTKSEPYWSSSPYALGNPARWVVNFNAGDVNSFHLYGNACVRAVRPRQ